MEVSFWRRISSNKTICRPRVGNILTHLRMMPCLTSIQNMYWYIIEIWSYPEFFQLWLWFPPDHFDPFGQIEISKSDRLTFPGSRSRMRKDSEEKNFFCRHIFNAVASLASTPLLITNTVKFSHSFASTGPKVLVVCVCVVRKKPNNKYAKFQKC